MNAGIGNFRSSLLRLQLVFHSSLAWIGVPRAILPTRQAGNAAEYVNLLQRRRPLSSSTSGARGDAVEKMMDLMRKIVNRGGRRGRKQEIVPKEVVGAFCIRYSQLDDSSKEELLLSLARDFTPTPESVSASVTRYANCLSGEQPTSGPSEEEHPLRRVESYNEVPPASSAERIALPRFKDETYRGGRATPSAKALAVKHAGREREHTRAYERLRDELSPGYEAFFRNVVAESDDGVRFIVHLRQDLLRLMRKSRDAREDLAATLHGHLAALDGSLRSLLQSWFSVGFLELQRITYEGSGGALLERIARYEAVHPVRSLGDLKRRLGRGRRCFAFFHPCLPDEPLVFVHVALLPKMARTMDQIRGEGMEAEGCLREEEARCAVFYSISSTQKGLQGVQLGNFLIKRVVAQLRAELPQLETFATLSPVPSFREWLSTRAMHRAALIRGGQGKLSGEPLLSSEESSGILLAAGASPPPLSAIPEGTDEEARREAAALTVLLADDAKLLDSFKGVVVGTNGGGDKGSDESEYLGRPPKVGYGNDGAVEGQSEGTSGPPFSFPYLTEVVRSAMLRLAARYLARETVRGKILDPVGNFHVSNGARLERVNWMADRSSKGIAQSFGVMVNYLYDPVEIEPNIQLYVAQGEVPVSDVVRHLATLQRTRGKEDEEKEEPKPAGFL